MRLTNLFATLPALALAAAAPAQQAAAPSFTPEAVRAHVEFLADDLLEGRDAGTRGYDIAARYVAAHFAVLGLRPGVNGSWYQQVAFQETQLADTPSKVTIGGLAFENGGDVLLGPGARELEQNFEAPAVFVGYGLDAPQQGLNDYAGLDVRGKMVVMLSGMPAGVPSDLSAHLSSTRNQTAEAKGAIGIITLRTRQDEQQYPWEAIKAYITAPALTWVGKDDKAFSAAPGVRTSFYASGAAADALFAGSGNTLKAILDDAAKPNGKPKGFALKPSVKVERHSKSSRTTSPNVLAVLPGSDPALAGEYVLLMAHLDHNGTDPALEGADKIYNGAMDNASGIATMLEVARAMATAPTRPKRSVLFAAVTAEEDGLLGSQYLAKNPVVGSGKVVGVVNLDMPILTYDFQDVTAFGAEHSTLGPIVERAAAGMNVKVSPDPLPEEQLFVRSDHYRFVQEGVPAVFLMTGFAGEGREKFTHFLSTNYHQVSDQTNLPFNWQAGAKFARLNYLIAREIADAPQAPLWYQGNTFGNLFAPNQPKAPKP